jgi:hypothetical protein
MGLASVLRLEALAAKDVLVERDGFEVLRVDAVPDAAEVIEREPIGDRTDEQLVRDAVRSDEMLPVELEPAVAVIEPALPEPAPVFRHLDAREQAVDRAHRLFRPRPVGGRSHGVVVVGLDGRRAYTVP